MILTVQRTGLPQLKVNSVEELASGSSLAPNWLASLRWHTIAVHKLDNGGLLVCVSYRVKRKKKEHEHHAAWVKEGLAEVVEYLHQYKPLSKVMGWPNTEQYRERNEEIKKDLQMRWEGLVSRVLEKLGVVECV